MTTMHEKYKDGSGHQVCEKCGLCKTCGDCVKYGCGGKKNMRLKILYRKNLKMSPGKLAAQAVHAAIGLGVEDPLISVVVLQMSDLKYRACISELKDRPHYRVKDAGRTELEPGTESCVAFLE